MATNGAASAGNAKLDVLLAIFDFPMLSIGFQRAIDAETDMQVVGIVDDRAGLRERIQRSGADVVIVECSPYADGACTAFAAIEEIKATKPALKIVALECRCGSEQFSLALKAGADGFLNREARPADVVTAVRCVSAGQTYVCPAIVTRMVNTYVLRTTQTAISDPYDHLSEREREVLLLAAMGHTNREIAQTLHLSEQTIHNYRANIMEKLGFHDRVELLKYALRRGVLTVADL
jgi:two-component system, NarL family, response regulator NreC